MGDVKRWFAQRGTTITESPNGDYVLASDYAALEAERDELREECERLREMLYQERIAEDDQRRQLEAAQENLAGYQAERDTLRQQLADSDAALRESRANDQAAMGHLADMRQQLAERDAELKHARQSIQHMIDQTTPLVPDPDNPGWAKRIQLDDVIAQRDKLAGLLAKAQEELDPHRHAVLWGEICAALAEVKS